mmetsp:Transcript_25272/g.69500  ORF Transcript_25272/g.69500 Transcript_25272/m.69500 type:complete len:238 (-) Transcript_25272:1658-2371(-)
MPMREAMSSSSSLVILYLLKKETSSSSSVTSGCSLASINCIARRLLGERSSTGPGLTRPATPPSAPFGASARACISSSPNSSTSLSSSSSSSFSLLSSKVGEASPGWPPLLRDGDSDGTGVGDPEAVIAPTREGPRDGVAVVPVPVGSSDRASLLGLPPGPRLRFLAAASLALDRRSFKLSGVFSKSSSSLSSSIISPFWEADSPIPAPWGRFCTKVASSGSRLKDEGSSCTFTNGG